MSKSHLWLKASNLKLSRKAPREMAGQGMVEFALTIPVLLLVLWGVIEFGWMLFLYSSVASASREAARYGAAVDNFSDCAGIREAAKRVGFAAGIQTGNITIRYTDLKGGATHTGCETLSTADIVPGSRIEVEVSVDYSPLVPLPLPKFTLQSINAHTIVTNLFLVERSTTSGSASYIYVASLLGTNQPVGSEPTATRQAVVDIHILDSDNKGARGATVTGNFVGHSGYSDPSRNCTTDVNGWCTITSSNVNTAKFPIVFTVSSVSNDINGVAYTASHNLQTIVTITSANLTIMDVGNLAINKTADEAIVTVTITVTDNNGDAISDIEVNGNLNSKHVNSAPTCETGADGTCKVQMASLTNGDYPVTYTVEGLTDPSGSFTYDKDLYTIESITINKN